MNYSLKLTGFQTCILALFLDQILEELFKIWIQMITSIFLGILELIFDFSPFSAIDFQWFLQSNINIMIWTEKVTWER